jgi:ligand-binding sensor domain-containing protein
LYTKEDLFITLVVDKHGLWMSSRAGGLSPYNLTMKQLSNYNFSAVNKNIATNNIISDIKRKSENDLWISSLDRGFGIFNKTTLQFTFLGDSSGKNPGIPSSACSYIMLDKQNNI